MRAKRKLDFSTENKKLCGSHRLEKTEINKPYVHSIVSKKIAAKIRYGFKVGVGRVLYFYGTNGAASKYQFGKRYIDRVVDVDGELKQKRQVRVALKCRYGTVLQAMRQ